MKLIFNDKMEYWKTKKGKRLKKHKDKTTIEFLELNDMIQISEIEAKEIIIKNDPNRWKRKYTKKPKENTS